MQLVNRFVLFAFFLGQSFVFADSENFYAAQNEIKNLLYADIVAFQPKTVGFANFAEAMGAKPKDPNSIELSAAAKEIKIWPTIQLDKNGIVIIEGASRVRFEITDLKNGKFSINGKSFPYDRKSSLLSQIKLFLHGTRSVYPRGARFRLFINEAWADQNNPGVAVATATPVVLGVVAGAGTALMSLATGASVAVGAIPIAAGVVGSGALCTVAQNWAHGESFGKRYMNCITSPLSWFGLNPRDRLYLNKFEKCEDDKIVAVVKSSSGAVQKREFTYSGGVLKSVTLKDTNSGAEATLSANSTGSLLINGRVVAPDTATRTLSNELLSEAQTLVRDSIYYQGVCADAGRRDLIEAGMQQGDRAYDVNTPKELHEKAKGE